ncbi:MAG TPA: hypothetical protein VFQ53_38110 [Kofleriaceae bacterium]|nr:hypothetical protein [Kofleriaceae bacterium]
MWLGIALGSTILVALVGLVPGCYDLPKPACGFRCGPAGECPEDYACNAEDGRCHLSGSPAMVCGTIDAGIDGGIDAPDDAIDAPPDAPPDAPIDAPPDAPIDAAIDAAIDAS